MMCETTPIDSIRAKKGASAFSFCLPHGGLEITKQADIPILGGHTIKDPIPKYGLVVTGRVEKKDLTLNSTAKAGDVLILTKPL